MGIFMDINEINPDLLDYGESIVIIKITLELGRVHIHLNTKVNCEYLK